MTNANLAFGAAVERDLTDDTMMNFDSAHVEAPPAFIYSPDSTIVGSVNSHIDWMKQKRFDFGFVSSEAICIAPKIITLLPGDITNLTERSLMGQLAMDQAGSPGAPLHYEAGVPFTFGFQTYSGQMGILQLTGFTNNPRGVKIRYKLVEGNNSQSSSNSNLGPANIHSAQGKVVVEAPQGTITADNIFFLQSNHDRDGNERGHSCDSGTSCRSR